MAREFQVPSFYRSSGITAIKRYRQKFDSRKKDFAPTAIDFGPVRFKIARHFGFCFGVENAIEIAYKAVDENPGKRIFLLSEMIHNPQVNNDLRERGVQFLMDTSGAELIPFSSLTPKDIVIVPAFGTTIELQDRLSQIGIDPYYYDTTCPFVEKVWRRSADLGSEGFSVIVHGKRTHEETRATFSHSKETAPTLVILGMEDAEYVVEFMHGKHSRESFIARFRDSMSGDFDPNNHLKRIGVVNQTTMLATETQAIADKLRQAMVDLYGEENIKQHFADTRDTLCYATHENQRATEALIEAGADLAIVVGGYNSSNTSHLVELCEQRMPTFYIKNADEIIDHRQIRHFDLSSKDVNETENWLPKQNADTPIEIALTSGASCPDKTVDQVMQRIVELFSDSQTFEEVLAPYLEEMYAAG